MSNVTFIDYLTKKHAICNAQGDSVARKNWMLMKRDFRQVYNQTATKYLMHFASGGVKIPPSDIDLLVAYMLGKGVLSFDVKSRDNEYLSIGRALRIAGRNEQYLNQLIGLPLHRLLPKLKQLTSLLVSNNVKINIKQLAGDLHKIKSGNKETVVKWWVINYYSTATKESSND